jgi:CheY-like chemotaxis protein
MNTQHPVIIYVEDDEPSITVMKAVIEKVMGLPKLHILPSDVDFIQKVKQLGVQPDIFLLDIQMEPFDGFDLLAMLRKEPQYSSSKVVALTASVTNEEVSLLKKNGFDGAIAKPLDIQAFPDLIARTMNGEQVWHVA